MSVASLWAEKVRRWYGDDGVVDGVRVGISVVGTRLSCRTDGLSEGWRDFSGTSSEPSEEMLIAGIVLFVSVAECPLVC